MLNWSLGSRAARRTRVPLTRVPLVLPRSRSRSRPSVLTMMQCILETLLCSSRRSHSSLRPTTTTSLTMSMAGPPSTGTSWARMRTPAQDSPLGETIPPTNSYTLLARRCKRISFTERAKRLTPALPPVRPHRRSGSGTVARGDQDQVDQDADSQQPAEDGDPHPGVLRRSPAVVLLVFLVLLFLDDLKVLRLGLPLGQAAQRVRPKAFARQPRWFVRHETAQVEDQVIRRLVAL